MANKTIYGCVNRATGAITFQGEACDSGDYTGCIERTGIHAGQVKVVINEVNCDDTYYGCVNRTTGKFQVIIPDDCCYGYGNDCSCFAPGETPKYYQIVISGVSNCPSSEGCECNDAASAVNGIWIIAQDADNSCLWTSGGDSCTRPIALSLKAVSGTKTALIAGSAFWEKSAPICQITGSESNEFDFSECCPAGMGQVAGYGGTGSWAPA